MVLPFPNIADEPVRRNFEAQDNDLAEAVAGLTALVTSLTPPGVIHAFAGVAAPAGFLLCEGQSLLRADYPSLFAAISTTYGAADSLHFNLPDLRGRAIYGVGPHADVALGAMDSVIPAGRTPKHVLTQAEMPSHSHGIGPAANAQTFYPAGAGGYVASSPGTTGTLTNPGTTSTGGGGAHDHNYLALNYIIKS